MINHKSIRDLTIDDDKLRYRSKLWKQIVYSQRQGIPYFGDVLNVACQAPLGKPASMVMSGFNENINDTIIIMLQKYSNVKRERLIDINAGTLNGDRRYEFDSKAKYHQFMPFTFGN